MEHWESKRQVFQQCQEKNNDLISFWIGYIGEQVKRNSFQMLQPDKNNKNGNDILKVFYVPSSSRNTSMKLKQLFCLIPFIESFLDFLSMVIKINKRMRKSLSVFTIIKSQT